jgi:4a-hydroxytetrahydrobiopterin dehydratase
VPESEDIMARLSETDVRDRLKALSGWALKGDAIEKTYSFADFAKSMELVNRVAALAEEANHHPDIFVQYNRVTLTLTSHDSGGLTARDFRLAEQIDA